ncbi:MAG: type II toxin-antitoxin system RelE/ParE family toxin [Proteobacteria bacterium]|nr:type II toxin-antitoxin system RelE/ParE family toxin [Pseudomonadota bacterium]
MKPLLFVDSSREDLIDMPAAVRHTLGMELMRVQWGSKPHNFKPMATVGAGVHELRVRDVSGAYRVIYVAKFADAVYVLHAFQKKTQKTAKADIELAARRYRALVASLK